MRVYGLGFGVWGLVRVWCWGCGVLQLAFEVSYFGEHLVVKRNTQATQLMRSFTLSQTYSVLSTSMCETVT